MTDGERLVRCLTGGDIDRVPFGCGLGWQPWPETSELYEANWRAEGNSGVFNYNAVFGFDNQFADAPCEAGMFPRLEEVVIKDEGDTRIERDWRGIVMRVCKTNRSIPEFLEYPVKTPEDWDRLKSERFSLAPAALDARMVARENEMRRFILSAKANGCAVQIEFYPFGAFACVRDYLGAEEALMAFYTEPEMVKDMMFTSAKVWLAVYERVCDRLAKDGVSVDHFHFWEDMSGRNGSLISPAMVEEFMMPIYDMVADFCGAYKIRVISVDTDGDCSELVPIMIRHGVNTFLPFEAQAGCDIREYRSLYPTLGVMGGLDKRAMARDKAAVDEQIAIAAEMVKHGRYVPGFDHHIPPDCRYDLFKYAVESIRKVCGKL